MVIPHRPSRWAQDEGVNLTPLLDVIFNLIFFFLLATSIRQQDALKIKLPESKNAEQLEAEKKAMIIAITPDDQFVLEGETMPMDTLIQRIKAESTAKDFGGVVIRGDRDSHLQAAVDAFSACRDAGVLQVRIDVNRPKGGG